MLPVLLLFCSVLIFRLVPALAGGELERTMTGISPLFAFALCGGLFFPRKWALPLSVGLVLLPHFIINATKGFPVIHPYAAVIVACVVLSVIAGIAVRKKATLARVVGLSVLSTVLFHLLSNTVSFFMDPGYTRTLSGWFQAQTTGLPEFQPQTWVFSLKQLLADAGFTALFYFAMRARPAAPAPVPAAAPALTH